MYFLRRTCTVLHSTPHIMGYGPGRPAKTRGPSHGPGECRHRSSSSTPRIMDLGPGRPVKTRGPRHERGRSSPHKAHMSWTAARPGPTNFESMGRGPPRPINFQDYRPGPVRLGPSHFLVARPGPTRSGPHHPPLTSPAYLMKSLIS